MQLVRQIVKNYQLENTIKRKYKKDQERLTLDQSPNKQWMEIILYQDWSSLKILQLVQCRIHDEEVKLVGGMRWPNLRELIINANHLTHEGVANLFNAQNNEAPKFPALESLNLDDNSIQTGLSMILASTECPRLEKLNAVFNNIQKLQFDSTLLYNLSNLKHLNLIKNQIGNAGIKVLIKMWMPVLQKIELYNCRISGEGTKHMSKAQWPRLKQLNMNDDRLDSATYEALCGNNWKQLTILRINIFVRVNGINLMSVVASEWKYETKVRFRARMHTVIRAVINDRHQL